MKLDIILDNVNSTLQVSDFHISPISNNASYTYKSEENLLNNSHLDNIKSFYNSTKGNFYRDILDAKYNHNYPIICKEDEVLDAYSNVYDMGCKRSNSYLKYNKQFELFCPVWIEQLDGDLKIAIKLKPYTTSKTKNVIVTKVLNFTSPSDTYSDTHNKFIKYLNEYFDTCNIVSGDNNLLNIKFADNSAKIHGIDVESGIITNKSLNALVNNITSIERPMMEVDNMIIESFSSNKIIAKQLLNLNLCFNLSDIISDTVANLILGESFDVDAEVYINDKKLEKRDFYTNYEFIERSSFGNNVVNISENVFDYLNDYKSIDLINKNKFSQNICHWSLVDSNDYIFNLYEGFSGIRVELIKNNATNTYSYMYYENAHNYKNFPNLTSTLLSNANQIGWINAEFVEGDDYDEFFKYILKIENTKKNGTLISNKRFINGIKYNDFSNEIGDVYILGLAVNDFVYNQALNAVKKYDLHRINILDETNNKLDFIRNDNLLMIVTTEQNNLMYKSFSDILYTESVMNHLKNQFTQLTNNIISEEPYIRLIYNLIDSIVFPEIVMFGNGLNHISCNGPTIHTTEIEYVKNDNHNYVLRYDGKLRPTFIDKPLNVLYHKDYVSDDRKSKSKFLNSKYAKYVNTGYEPLYPSIDYYSINKLNNWKYDELPNVKNSEHENVSVLTTYEYSWFDTNRCIMILPHINFNYVNTKRNGFKTIDEIVENYISDLYRTKDTNMIKYIVSKYNVKTNWEYLSNKNVDDYLYTINLELK